MSLRMVLSGFLSALTWLVVDVLLLRLLQLDDSWQAYPQPVNALAFSQRRSRIFSSTASSKKSHDTYHLSSFASACKKLVMPSSKRHGTGSVMPTFAAQLDKARQLRAKEIREQFLGPPPSNEPLEWVSPPNDDRFSGSAFLFRVLSLVSHRKTLTRSPSSGNARTIRGAHMPSGS